MKIKTQNFNEKAVVELKGEFTQEFIKALQEATTTVITEGAIGIILDMTEVRFIDSAGLEHLLWLRDYCNENKRQFKIVGLDESCTKIFEITRLLPQFDIYGEIDEAVKSFA